jgi:hypothetical protein
MLIQAERNLGFESQAGAFENNLRTKFLTHPDILLSAKRLRSDNSDTSSGVLTGDLCNEFLFLVKRREIAGGAGHTAREQPVSMRNTLMAEAGHLPAFR